MQPKFLILNNLGFDQKELQKVICVAGVVWAVGL
jgi:hypothetical protein